MDPELLLAVERAWTEAVEARAWEDLAALAAEDFRFGLGMDRATFLAWVREQDDLSSHGVTTRTCGAVAHRPGPERAGIVFACPVGPIEIGYVATPAGWKRSRPRAMDIDTRGPNLALDADLPWHLVSVGADEALARRGGDHRSVARLVWFDEVPAELLLVGTGDRWSVGGWTLRRLSDGTFAAWSVEAPDAGPLPPCPACRADEAAALVGKARWFTWTNPEVVRILAGLDPSVALPAADPELVPLGTPAGRFVIEGAPPVLAGAAVRDGVSAVGLPPDAVGAALAAWADAGPGRAKRVPHADGFGEDFVRKRVVVASLRHEPFGTSVAFGPRAPAAPPAVEWATVDLPRPEGVRSSEAWRSWIDAPIAPVCEGDGCTVGLSADGHAIADVPPVVACLRSGRPAVGPGGDGVALAIVSALGVEAALKIDGERVWNGYGAWTAPCLPAVLAGAVGSDELWRAAQRVRAGEPPGNDAWGRPVGVEPVAGGVVLRSLGRDGAPGGTGLDADRWWGRDGVAQEPPAAGIRPGPFADAVAGALRGARDPDPVSPALAACLAGAVPAGAAPRERGLRPERVLRLRLSDGAEVVVETTPVPDRYRTELLLGPGYAYGAQALWDLPCLAGLAAPPGP